MDSLLLFYTESEDRSQYDRQILGLKLDDRRIGQSPKAIEFQQIKAAELEICNNLVSIIHPPSIRPEP
jgi:hypothetical protein